MRGLIISVFILTVSNTWTQIPDYFGNNPSWHCGYWFYDVWGNQDTHTEDIVYYIGADTTISSFDYKHIYRRGYTYINGTNESYFNEPTNHFVRQVGRTIRYFDVSQNTDSLFMDYSLTIGDVNSVLLSGCGLDQDTIQKVDSILVGSDYRRILYNDTVQGVAIYEGIGHLELFSEHSGEMYIPGCQGGGFSYSLYCYGENDIPLWDASYGSSIDCHVNVGVEQSQFLDFKIVPNPATDFIEIKGLIKESFQVDIYSLEGKKHISSSAALIDVSSLNQGVYMLIITDSNGNASSQKLILK